MTLIRALAAGFIATAIVSVLMLARTSFGYPPAFDLIATISLHIHTDALGGWITHFVIGTVIWGLLFAAFDRAWLGPPAWAKGLAFGVLTWLAMMLLFMPSVDVGLFASALPAQIQVMASMAVIHLLHGGIMGWIYGRLMAATRRRQMVDRQMRQMHPDLHPSSH